MRTLPRLVRRGGDHGARPGRTQGAPLSASRSRWGKRVLVDPPSHKGCVGAWRLCGVRRGAWSCAIRSLSLALCASRGRPRGCGCDGQHSGSAQLRSVTGRSVSTTRAPLESHARACLRGHRCRHGSNPLLARADGLRRLRLCVQGGMSTPTISRTPRFIVARRMLYTLGPSVVTTVRGAASELRGPR